MAEWRDRKYAELDATKKLEDGKYELDPDVKLEDGMNEPDIGLTEPTELEDGTTELGGCKMLERAALLEGSGEELLGNGRLDGINEPLDGRSLELRG